MSSTSPIFAWAKNNLPLVILIGPFAILFLLWFFLVVIFQYEIGSAEGMASRQLEKALEARNPQLCKRVIIMDIMMGPARYDIINGCYTGYASKTGDISLCMGVLSPGGCVERIAEDRNDASLCEKAIDPRRLYTDRRGSCFGYFAGKEKDYGYCDQLHGLENMNEAQKRICFNAYMDGTGDLELCLRNRDLFAEVELSRWTDSCHLHVSRVKNDQGLCNTIRDPEIHSRCLGKFTTDQ